MRLSAKQIYSLLASAMLAAPGLASAGVIITDPGSTTLQTAGSDQTVGYAFTVGSANIQVTALGMFAPNVFVQPSHRVGVWSSDGTSLLASAVVTNSSTLSDNFRYQSITPITLLAGQTYITGVELGAYGGAPSDPYLGLTGSFSSTADVNFFRYRYSGSFSGFSFPSNYSDSFAVGQIFIGPNLQYAVEAPVPEPATSALLAIAAVGLLRRRPRRA